MASDLICYPCRLAAAGLVERQAIHWRLGALRGMGARRITGLALRMLLRSHGAAHRDLHDEAWATALAAAGAAIPGDPHGGSARVHSVTTLTGSALLALALASGAHHRRRSSGRPRMSDEDWNMEQWGPGDELALERRAYRYAELQAAATVLKNT